MRAVCCERNWVRAEMGMGVDGSAMGKVSVR